MCGVAGFSGTIGNKYVRLALTEALGIGIDKRGGHASGWAAMTNGSVQTAKRLGSWQEAGLPWILPLATASSAILHARWATHGSKEDVTNAHPFTVRRGERTILHGIHNGVLQNTPESAARNNRSHSVDSKEFFQLLADGDRAGIAKLGGYGVVLWMKPRSNNVYVCKLTASADFYMCRTAMGGLVFGSTEKIVKDACKAVGVSLSFEIPVTGIGRTYIISGDNWRCSNNRALKLKAGGQTRLWSDYGSYDYPRTHTSESRPTYGMKSPTEESVPDWQARRMAYQATGDGWDYEPNARYEKGTDGQWYKVDKVTGQRTLLGSTLLSRDKAGSAKADKASSDKEWQDLVENPATVCQHGLPLTDFCNVCDVYSSDSEREAIRDMLNDEESPETEPSSAYPAKVGT